MTEEQLKRSEVVKAKLKAIFENPSVVALLDMLQKRALPSRRRPAELIPGVHADTAVAHDHNYWAGWSDVIEEIKTIHSSPGPIEESFDEELWSHLPEIRAIDQEIEAARKAIPPAS